MGMAHNIPSYLLASGLIAVGMDWLQAFLTITLGNLIVLVPMLLNSHAGTKIRHSLPGFRASLLWRYAARTWRPCCAPLSPVAGLYSNLGRRRGGLRDRRQTAGSGWINAAPVGGKPWTVWLSFALFWLLQMAIIWRGIDAIRPF